MGLAAIPRSQSADVRQRYEVVLVTSDVVLPWYGEARSVSANERQKYDSERSMSERVRLGYDRCTSEARRSEVVLDTLLASNCGPAEAYAVALCSGGISERTISSYGSTLVAEATLLVSAVRSQSSFAERIRTQGSAEPSNVIVIDLDCLKTHTVHTATVPGIN